MKWTLPLSCMDPDVDDIWSIIPRLAPTERLMSAAVSSGPARLCLPAVCVVWSSPPPAWPSEIIKKYRLKSRTRGHVDTQTFLTSCGRDQWKNANPNTCFFHFQNYGNSILSDFFTPAFILHSAYHVLGWKIFSQPFYQPNSLLVLGSWCPPVERHIHPCPVKVTSFFSVWKCPGGVSPCTPDKTPGSHLSSMFIIFSVSLKAPLTIFLFHYYCIVIQSRFYDEEWIVSKFHGSRY